MAPYCLQLRCRHVKWLSGRNGMDLLWACAGLFFEERTMSSGNLVFPIDERKSQRDEGLNRPGWIGRHLHFGCGVLGSHTTCMIYRSIHTNSSSNPLTARGSGSSSQGPSRCLCKPVSMFSFSCTKRKGGNPRYRMLGNDPRWAVSDGHVRSSTPDIPRRRWGFSPSK